MLKDKVTLVTGSSKGIGYGIAENLAAKGSNLIINARNSEQVNSAVAQLKEKYPSVRVIGVPADISKGEDVKRLYEVATTEFEVVHNVVNNAGVTRDNLIMRMKEEDWDAVMDINLKSAFLVTKAFIRPMLKHGGKIVLMSSIVGQSGNQGQANYAASKGGLIAMGKSMAKEFAAKKINVNMVTPGFIRTEMTDVLTDEVKNGILNSIPQKRLGEVEDIANAVAFLLSSDSDYITGQVLAVNGGMLM